jgi:hypothetical protein
MNVVESAEQGCQTILATYSAPNVTGEQIQLGESIRQHLSA